MTKQDNKVNQDKSFPEKIPTASPILSSQFPEDWRDKKTVFILYQRFLSN